MARHKKNFRKAHRGHYKKQFLAYPFLKNEELTLRIESLSALGHGVARIDHTPASGEPVKNWVIFVPFALPSELVKVAITENLKKNSIGKIVEVIEPSEHRVEPACKHFFYCGGCQFQHLEYEQQLCYQADHLRQQLSRIAGIDHPVNPTIGSPKIWHYRSKITPHYKKPEKDKIHAIGFLHHSDKDQIVDLQQCQIAMQPLNDTLPKLKQRLKSQARTIKKDGSLLMRVSEDSVATSESTTVKETVGELDFHFLAGDFFQNNPYILEDFTNYVASQALGSQYEYLVDAYCGCGLFGLSLAKHFKQVTGVEVSATSTDWARYNAESNNIDNATFVAGSAEKIFDSIDYPSEQTVMVIDPPRAGCNQEFLQQLFAYKPAKLVYVSCDPSTQMRDLKGLVENGYVVKTVQPIDLFPHTRHLECVVTLERA